jgi:ATP-binding cassette, subfamily B, bacterial
VSATTHLLRPYYARQWPALAGAGFSTVMVTLAELAKPWPLALVIDRLLAGHEGAFELRDDDLVLLGGIALLVVAIAITDALANYFSELMLKRAGETITHDLRVAVYSHLQRLSLGFHHRSQTGDLVTRVTGDVNAVGTIFADSLGALVQALLLLAGMVVVSLFLDPQLTLVAFAITPLLAFVTLRSRRRLRTLSRRQRRQEGQIASIASEALAAMPVVKSLGTEDFESERVSQRSEERRRIGLAASRTEARFSGAVDVLGAFSAAVVIVYGVFRVAAGALSPGDLVVFVSYTRRIYRPLRDMARQMTRMVRAMARAERIAELLATDEALPESPDPFHGTSASGEVALEGVSFAYKQDRPALDGITLHVPAGSRLAVVGRSGAGKSTLGALIARFYDPDAGRVTIDGRDIRDCSLAWLREQVGFVLQETMLFTGTVAENIAYGTDARREDVVWAARLAAADDFISELPDGYETELGPRGVGLSGGQRQRLGIARTLLRNPAILILDEPTTGLDPDSEAQVLEGLATLMEGRTTLMITHSTALAGTADRVVVLEEGRIVEEGPPADVLERERGLRRRLFAKRRAQARIAPRRPTPVRRAGPPPAPHDPALPHMPRLLDAEQMAPVLQRSLGRPAEVKHVRPLSSRYKPGYNLRVHYEAEVDGVREEAVVMIAADGQLRRMARKDRYLAIARAVNARSPALLPLVYDEELDALTQWLPLDLWLPGLTEPPERLCLRLEAAGLPLNGDTGAPRRLSYKPKQHAVLRLGDHAVKAYAHESRYRSAEARLRGLPADFPVLTPPLEAAFADLRVIVQPFLPGRAPASAASAARAAGAMLRSLHAARLDGLETSSPTSRLQTIARYSAVVETLRPEASARLRALLRMLEDEAPAAVDVVPSHGDFHARQLVEHDGELAVLDLDRMCAAPAVLDLAAYAADTVAGSERDLDVAGNVLVELIEGYGSPPAHLHWYLAAEILRRAPHPFRCLQPDWPERIDRVLHDAERALVGEM